jgi:hypothetical protein
VLTLKGCGKVRVLALAHSGIHTVSNLKALTKTKQEKVSQLSQEKGHVSISLLAKLYKQASNCRDNDCPADIDYRKAQNPYKEKYGNHHWKKKIRKSAAMRPFLCITELVKPVIGEGKQIFKGMTHENNWVFYHDALSLMTAKDTKE